jgi:hypothetical protein
MNRTIKFRAWMKKEFSLPRASYDTFTIQELMSGKYEFSKYENWEQFTGLLDRNGKKIYEGDLFQDEEDGSFNCVEWSETHAGWTTNEWFTPLELSQQSHSLEIIGNLYENPELLKV